MEEQGQEVVEVETEVSSPEVEPETDALPEEGEPAAPVEDETDEWEHEGKKYKIPKAAKPLMMMQADYTRKTQELAEQRKAFQAEREQYQQANQEYLRDVSKVLAIDDQIEQYKALDWNRLAQEDPSQAQALFIQFQQLKDKRADAAAKAERAEHERQAHAYRTMAERREAGLAELQRSIPNWGPDVDKAISNFAIESGFSQQEVAGITDPRVVKMLHNHMTASAEVKRLKAEIERLTKPQPAKKVGGTTQGTSKRLSDPNISDKEWLAIRQSQLKRQRG